jgi:hypothetical protein
MLNTIVFAGIDGKMHSHKRLGKGASVLQESLHFAHWLGNKRMILDLTMTLRKRKRAERLAGIRRLRKIRKAIQTGAKDGRFHPWPITKWEKENPNDQ